MSEEWRQTTLGEVAQVVGGGTPSTKNEAFWGDDHVWLTPTEVVKQDGGIVSGSTRKISAAGLAGSSATLLPRNTVLLTSRASVGFVALAGCQLATNQGFQSLIPDASVLPRYLMYWVQANREEFTSRAGGSTFPEISKSNVKLVPITVPPLAVQRRIVDVVGALDAHTANLQTEADAITRAWRAAINNQYDGSVATRPFGEVVAEGSGRLVDGDWIESKDQSPAGIRLLQLADIGRGIFINKSSRFVSEQTFQRLRCTPTREGDLLISRMADPIGRTSAVPAALA